MNLTKIKNCLFTLTFILFANILISQSLFQEDTIRICGNNYSLSSPFASNFNVWCKKDNYGIILSNNLPIEKSGKYYLFTATPGVNDTTICVTFDLSNLWQTSLNVPQGYIISDLLHAYWGTPNMDCNNPTPGNCNIDVKSIIQRSLIGRTNMIYNAGQFPDPCSGVYKTLFIQLKCLKYQTDSVFVSLIKNNTNIHLNDTLICQNSELQISLPALTCDTTIFPVDSFLIPVNNTIRNTVLLDKGQLYRIKVTNVISFGGGDGNQADGAYISYPNSPQSDVVWRLNGNQPGTLMNFRPTPDGYNSNHMYYYYFLGDGNVQDLSIFDCCLNDNSGSLSFKIEKVIVNSKCNLNYSWNTVNGINFVNLPISTQPYILYLNDGNSSCPIDTISVQELTPITAQPQNQTLNSGNDAQFVVSASGTNLSYQWQSTNGGVFQNISDGGQYSGATNDTLLVSSVNLNNNNQQFRCVVTQNTCSTISDTVTLIVTGSVGIKGNQQLSSISVYPNPANKNITISNANNNVGEEFKLLDAIGKTVKAGKLKKEVTVLDISELAAGIYYILIGESTTTSFKVVKE